MKRPCRPGIVTALATLGALSTSAPALTPAPQQVAPYGSWVSTIGAERLAESAIGLAELKVHRGQVYWRESRPAEGGRQVIMSLDADGKVRQLTPEAYNVRTRVHEYGGASYLVLDEGLVFSHFADQRLYLQRGDAAPVAITPPGYRYADCTRHPSAPSLVCVREDHTAGTVAAHGEERNEIVLVDLPGAGTVEPDAGRVLVTGTDFVAYPRLSPDGRRLAWLWWNHPQMPWDSARLSVAAMTGELVGEATVIGGGDDRAAIEPHWDRDGTLLFIDDPSGWWNLYAWHDGTVRPLAPMAREFGGPLWQHGASTYASTGDGRAIVRSSLAGVDTLGLLDLRSGALRQLELPFVAFGEVRRLDERHVVAIAYPDTETPALIAVDIDSGKHRIVHRPAPTGLPLEWISRAQAIEFPTRPGPDGQSRSAHAFYYPPTNPHYSAPDDERPPLIVTVHGGPTSATKPVFSLARQYWTSRGFALVDVNYGGSTTFGREYRRRLNGQWGVVDLHDAVAAVEHLIGLGRVDPDRIAIRGGSAGGYLVLAALAFTDRFDVGANWFGVSDIQGLAQTSHKFERKYDVSLVGPPDPALYRARSPIHHLERFTEPLITFQGAQDRIVTPDQSRRIFQALKSRGVPTAYIEFEGEQHGFRRAGSIVRAYEAELYFYGRILGFAPAGKLAPVEIHNLPAAAAPAPH
ncbi:MAG TPA: prolyl oligopeptidase family serine peptidase [Xanthomonadaceae bacterium]|nr:prolyl oligopeptidase family serine peptidase [Xanthomonadaceae bacterium]